MHAALASTARRRLLELLRASDIPRDAHDLARAIGLHLSTVRFHLEVLRHAGLVVRQPHPQAGIGRPRTAYAAFRRHSADTADAYQELAGLLAAHLSDTTEERAARAERAGVAWAQQLVPTIHGVDHAVDDTARQVSGLFAEIGFEPELTTTGKGLRQIAMHACPFRDVAREHPEVVCSVHLGLLRGSLTRLGASTTSRLLPFVEPELCLVQLASDG